VESIVAGDKRGIEKEKMALEFEVPHHSILGYLTPLEPLPLVVKDA